MTAVAPRCCAEVDGEGLVADVVATESYAASMAGRVVRAPSVFKLAATLTGRATPRRLMRRTADRSATSTR